MADTKIGKAVLELTIDDTQYKFALDKIKSDAKDAADSVRGISQAINLAVWKELGQLAVSALEGVVGEVVKLGERGSDVEDVSHAFEVLSEKTHSTADVMLGALREGVVGTLSDFDLMKAGNRLLGAGFIQTKEDMLTVAEGARMLSKATGTDLASSFETMTKVIASGRAAKLNALGLFVDTTKAAEKFGQAHGVATENLSKFEKASGTAQEVLAQLRQRLAEMGPQAVDFRESIEQAKVRIENFHDALAVAVAMSPVFAAAFSSFADSLTNVFGKNQEEAVANIVHMLEDFSIALVKAGGFGVEAARTILNAWHGLDAGFNMSAQFLVKYVSVLLKVADTLEAVGVALNLPGFSQKTYAQIRELSVSLEELSGGFKKQANDAVDSALKQNIALDRVKTAFDGLGDAMVAAQGKSQVAIGKTAAELQRAAAEARTLADKELEQRRKIAAEIEKLNADAAIAETTGLQRRLAEIQRDMTTELAKARELTKGVAGAYDTMEKAIVAKYAALSNAAVLQGTKTVEAHRKTVVDLLALTNTSVQQRLAVLQEGERQEIADLQYLQDTNTAEYDKMVGNVRAKYLLMAAAARGSILTQEQAFHALGLKSKDEMQTTAKTAEDAYQQIKNSGVATADQVREAWLAAEKAKREATGTAALGMTQSMQDWGSATVSIIGDLGGKHKDAAIAGAIISTYMAVAKTAASIPWPASIPAKAAALVSGLATVAKIRSSEAGFRTGTPGLDFQDFGSQTAMTLHAEEAVIPKGGGHQLAGEIASSLKGGTRTDPQLAHLAKISAGIDNLPNTLKRAVRDGMLLANA